MYSKQNNLKNCSSQQKLLVFHFASFIIFFLHFIITKSGNIKMCCKEFFEDMVLKILPKQKDLFLCCGPEMKQFISFHISFNLSDYRIPSSFILVWVQTLEQIIFLLNKCSLCVCVCVMHQDLKEVVLSFLQSCLVILDKFQTNTQVRLLNYRKKILEV